jgi:chromatin remodeling complex protein RSC6
LKIEKYLKKLLHYVQTKTKMTDAEIHTTESEGAAEISFDELINQVEASIKDQKLQLTKLKLLKKEHQKTVKKLTTVTRRKKTPKDPNAPKKAPSGFTKPTKISGELATFLNISEEDLITRPDVTKAITKYIKEHDIQDELNKREIDLNKPGGKPLRDLLRVPDDVKLTFFNLQKFLKIHFPQSVKAAKDKKDKADAAEKVEKVEKAEKAEKSSKKKKDETPAVAAPPPAEEKPRRRRRVEEAAA